MRPSTLPPAPPARGRGARLAIVALVAVTLAPAQQAAGGDPAADAARAIRLWTADYEAGRLGPHGLLHRGANLQPSYVAAARRAGVVEDRDQDRLTHLDELQKLLYVAESRATADLADAVLGVCASGLDGAFLAPESLELREIGHWSMMRTESQNAWFVVLRAAAGERAPLLADLQPRAEAVNGDGLVVGPARRVAALRLLGMRGLPVFRSTIEAALGDEEPRVRLAAAEAIEFQKRAVSLPRLTEVLPRERHPVVVQALVRAVLGILAKGGEDVGPEVRAAAVTAALGRFGRCGWRADMELFDLVERFPDKAQIPLLIDALDPKKAPIDALVVAVNKQAAGLRTNRAWTLLRAMTGTLLSADDLTGWREFWEREQDRIVVPATLKREHAGGTSAAFFGVPVTGQSIAFVIDTSGSMQEAANGTAADGASRPRSDSRLEAAKEQILLAAQAMPAESRYVLLTFADRARRWTETPIRPGAGSLRSLGELLARLRPHGPTNLYEGLAEALQSGAQRYGSEVATTIDEMFLLSDGEPTAGVQDVEQVAKMLREANRYARVRINTVFTGSGKGADLLRRIAAENDGVFVQR